MTKLDRWPVRRPTFTALFRSWRRGDAAFRVVDDPSIDTSTRTGKLLMGILALIAKFENDIRRERQQDGINKVEAEGVRFGPKPLFATEMAWKKR